MKSFFLLLFCATCTFISAQVTQETFESYKLQEERTISYYVPESYNPDEKHPIILVLDADYLFDNVVANAKFYSRFQGMPNAIVVGVHEKNNEQRYNDTAFDEDTGLPIDSSKRFFEFLSMELLPYIENTYTTATFKMIFGYDATANFINFYLFKENSLFNAYVSIAPALAPEMETRIPQRIEALPNTIFYQLITEGEKTNASVTTLQNNLTAISKESFHYQPFHYQNADHIAIASYGIGAALDGVFGMFKPISPAEYREKILKSEAPVFEYLTNKKQMITDLFGFEKPTALNDIMAIYAACRKKEDATSLKSLADLCKKDFNGTMLGFYFEAEYYEQIGAPKKALRTYEKAFGMDEIDFLTKDMALEKIDAIKADFGY